MKFVVLLRGINVGGHNKILMADLRMLLSKSREIRNIQTYIQSGNIIFESEIENKLDLSKIIYTYIYKEYGFEIPVQVYNFKEWEGLMEINPYIGKTDIIINSLYVTLLDGIPSEQNISILNQRDFSPDSFIIIKNVIYIYYYLGAGKSKMTLKVFENKLKVSATSRNWRTMCKIKELLSN